MKLKLLASASILVINPRIPKVRFFRVSTKVGSKETHIKNQYFFETLTNFNKFLVLENSDDLEIFFINLLL